MLEKNAPIKAAELLLYYFSLGLNGYWSYRRGTAGLYWAGRKIVHLMIEMLVERELWRLSSPPSPSKEDCCHQYIRSAVALPLLKYFKHGESGGEEEGMFAAGSPVKFIARCPGPTRTHKGIAT